LLFVVCFRLFMFIINGLFFNVVGLKLVDTM